jgi:Protein of unknown function (DUF1571)
MMVSRCTRCGVGFGALLFACVLPAVAAAQNAPVPNYPAPSYRALDERAAPAGIRQPAALPTRTAASPRYPVTPYSGPAVRRPALKNAIDGRVVPAQYEESADHPQIGAPMAPLTAPAAGPMGPMQVRDSQAGNRPPLRVADATSIPAGVPGLHTGEAIEGEHPLAPAIRWAKQGMETLNKVEDYQCTMVKRERIGGELGEHEYMFVKVRHKPFSVYTYFLAPSKVKGQEAVYIEGRNDGNMLAHGNGVKHRLFGTVSLKPTSLMAMSGNRYPITEMGMRRLTERLIEIGSNDMQFGECNVNWIQGAKINNRSCTCIQVTHPVPRKNFLFNLARIYVDDELQLPTRYEAYDWPREPGGQPQLTEEYTFLNVKINNHFTDADFDTNNPSYAFK